MGVGGFILIVLGAILALIGIRNLWYERSCTANAAFTYQRMENRVQVFLSAGFLTSLGVVVSHSPPSSVRTSLRTPILTPEQVLIIYVMSPPVTNAVQGAYLVAVFSTGLTFGALAIVFKELTEGLGCLFGGFCFSMWLLTLKPGGLLTETSPKSGFIAAISVAFYALSFNHHTRPYGLIVSTGFAGGTAVTLGVDCFSRAGLKEFWLYIWGKLFVGLKLVLRESS